MRYNMSTHICSYGCGNIGNFKKIGRKGIEKWSCCENIQHCPSMIAKQRESSSNSIKKQKLLGTYQNRIEKMKKTINIVGPDGKTITERAAEKMLITRKANGSFKTGAIKSAKTKKKTIDPQTGLTIEQLAVKKANQTRMMIDESGTSIAQRTGRKAIETQMNTIDINTGKSLYELREINAKKLKSYKDTKLLYASTYEYKWLEGKEITYGMSWILSNISRGPTFKYYDNISNSYRFYPSDFIIGNTIYEIKSIYIFNKTPIDKARNILKLDTILANHYQCKLILNFIEYDWKLEKDKILSMFY